MDCARFVLNVERARKFLDKAKEAIENGDSNSADMFLSTAMAWCKAAQDENRFPPEWIRGEDL